MSTFNDIDLECENCGEEFRGTVWVAVHAGQDPELKELLLGGELNLVSCPSCAHVAFQERFLIYQDPAAELVAYVYPEIQKPYEAELRKAMRQGFDEAQAMMPEKQKLDYEPLLIFGLESLIEMLHEEEELGEQSQIAQAICKENNIAFEMLRPSQARQRHSVRVIPRTAEGLQQLLTINPALDRYVKLQQSHA